LLEFIGLLVALHNTIRYLYLQRRYTGNGISLVVFYTIAILIFSLRIFQIIITIDPGIDGESAKFAYIVGTNIVLLEFDIGVTMVMLVMQLREMLVNVVKFTRKKGGLSWK